VASLRRRAFLIGGAGLVAGAVLAKPRDRGGPYPPYFAELNATLRREGIAQPVMVVDLDRVDRNLERVRRGISEGTTYRAVMKSLPSLPLLEHVLAGTGTRAVMGFHQPFLNALVARRPEVEVLLGKPMPVAAARRFYAELPGRFDRIQWLVDTGQRLAQFRELARGLGLRLLVSFEIDVGLHRGGFQPDAAFVAALRALAADPSHLELAGFMGYDAHIGKLPGFLGDRAFRAARARYEQFVTLARETLPGVVRPGLTFNAAGSLTYRRYQGDPLVNDISAGSCLVKPADFDTPHLEDHEPAAFIATPVLKRAAGTPFPGVEWLSPLARAWDPNVAQSYFLYGGYWKAVHEAPPGLQTNGVYGRSTNQDLANASTSVSIDVDDFVFLRPTQSESVFLQFGDLVVVRGNALVDRWPVLEQDRPRSPA
jgi:D-serine deaminase-like pyridoxal phosphate-dependent protein